MDSLECFVKQNQTAILIALVIILIIYMVRSGAAERAIGERVLPLFGNPNSDESVNPWGFFNW